MPAPRPDRGPLRVVQWATGAVGRYALRSVIGRPSLELAGVLVHDPDKIGKDAGEVAGLSRTGIVCTGDTGRIMAMDADCVLHMPLPAAYFGSDHTADLKTICALLASGKNVITTTGIGSRRKIRHSWRTIARLGMRPPPAGQRQERALEGRTDDLD